MAKKDFKAGLSSIIPIIPDQTETKVKPKKKSKAVPAPAKPKKPAFKKHPFTVSEEHLDKIRYIAAQDPGGLKKVIHDALKAEINKFEKENGKIEL